MSASSARWTRRLGLRSPARPASALASQSSRSTWCPGTTPGFNSQGRQASPPDPPVPVWTVAAFPPVVGDGQRLATFGDKSIGPAEPGLPAPPHQPCHRVIRRAMWRTAPQWRRTVSPGRRPRRRRVSPYSFSPFQPALAMWPENGFNSPMWLPRTRPDVATRVGLADPLVDLLDLLKERISAFRKHVGCVPEREVTTRTQSLPGSHVAELWIDPVPRRGGENEVESLRPA